MKYIFLLLSISLVACSNNPSQDTADAKAGSAKQEYFSTHITEDGGKEFALALSFTKPSKNQIKQRHAKPGVNKQQSRSSDRTDRAQTRLDKLQQRLEYHLAQNQFCQQGYEIIEQIVIRGQVSIRGECKESADSVLQGHPAV